MRGLKSSIGLALAAAALAQAPAENAASVEGAAIHSVSGAPIARAHISLRGLGPNAKNYGALSTAEGKFSITGVAPGSYQATAERVGFFMPAGFGGSTTVAVALRSGEKRDDLKLPLAPLGAISGRVLDAEGEPVEAASVTIDLGQGISAIYGTTDDKGQFRLEGLQPGNYRVKAAVAALLSTPPEVRSDGTVEVRYVPTYYAGVTDYKSATRIEVKTGADIEGVEIRLVRAPMVRLSGRVIGVPPETRGVNLLFSQTTSSRGMAGVKNDGTFQIWNVDPARYLLSATWESGGQRVQTAPVDIEIGQTSIENLELRVIPPSDIAGQVVFEDDQARPQAAPQNQTAQQGSARAPTVELRTVDPGVPNAAGAHVSDLAADGSFHLTGVPAARYRVMLSWPRAWVKAVTLGTERMEGNVLNLRGGSGGASLTVLVSSGFGSITGTVTDDAGPVAGARVALVRDDFVSLGDVTFATTDGEGLYKIANVRPGAYRIAAVEENDNAPRAGSLDAYEDILVRIEVHSGDTLTGNLKRHPPIR